MKIKAKKVKREKENQREKRIGKKVNWTERTKQKKKMIRPEKRTKKEGYDTTRKKEPRIGIQTNKSKKISGNWAIHGP